MKFPLPGISLTDWEDDRETGGRVREVSLNLSLTHPMGPKSSAITETQVRNQRITSSIKTFVTLTRTYLQTLLPESRPGEIYMIDVDTANAGIPYADSFNVCIHFCISKASADTSRLSVYAGIKYKKNVWGIVKSE